MKQIEQLVRQWQLDLEDQSAEDVLEWAAAQFGSKAILASSLGAEDQVLTHMTAQFNIQLEIFTLDTGKLFSETYALLKRTEERYGITFKIYSPDATEVRNMLRTHGDTLFRRSIELRQLCCEIRKINPLKKALKNKSAWICGLRSDQSTTRQDLQSIEWDATNKLIKINPLAAWTANDVWNYIKRNKIPYNPLHDRGFPSIGCACCTRAVAPGEEIRAGRWWWEQPEHKECGLHKCHLQRA